MAANTVDGQIATKDNFAEVNVALVLQTAKLQQLSAAVDNE